VDAAVHEEIAREAEKDDTVQTQIREAVAVQIVDPAESCTEQPAGGNGDEPAMKLGLPAPVDGTARNLASSEEDTFCLLTACRLLSCSDIRSLRSIRPGRELSTVAENRFAVRRCKAIDRTIGRKIRGPNGASSSLLDTETRLRQGSPRMWPVSVLIESAAMLLAGEMRIT
jgi:hypothetical protein